MGKQYAILRVQKCKGAEIGAMQYHTDREPGKHTNPDIDQSRTRMNRELCPHAALAVRRNVARWVEKDARAADRVIKREVKSVRNELGALAAEAQQMRTSAKQLENERSSGRPESRSKGIDR